MKISIENNIGERIDLDGEDLTDAQEVFKAEIFRLKKMIEWDTGWTGIIIKAADRKVWIYESDEHIVDCSEQVQY